MKVITVEDKGLNTVGFYTGPFEIGAELEFTNDEYDTDEIKRLLEQGKIRLKK